MRRAATGSVVLGDGGLRADSAYDRLAAAGAGIALRLRGAVAERLGYSCSAGVGPNKLLAKIGSALNKPAMQTVLLPRAVEATLQVRVGVGCGAVAVRVCVCARQGCSRVVQLHGGGGGV
jgi:nucleotidyltransferase/DNA polymerase involved in DNA repair